MQSVAQRRLGTKMHRPVRAARDPDSQSVKVRSEVRTPNAVRTIVRAVRRGSPERLQSQRNRAFAAERHSERLVHPFGVRRRGFLRTRRPNDMNTRTPNRTEEGKA